MSHARKQIRDAAAALIAGLATTGTRVHVNRLWELQASDLPAWDVSTSVDVAEDSELVSMGRTQGRRLEIVFTGAARELTGEAVADKLDTMCEELETVLTKSALRVSVAIAGLNYEKTEFAFDVDETDQAIGYAIVTYAVAYHTTEGAPGALT